MITEHFSQKNNYAMNHYRHKKLDKKHLLTTDQGSWTILDEEDYSRFKKGDMGNELLSSMKKKGFILTDDNIDEQVSDYRKRYKFIFQGTSLHIIIPTLRCNLKCAYCHANAKPLDAKGYDMSLETAKKVVDIIFQSPSHNMTIEFQGGEPLLRFDTIRHIIAYAKEKNIAHKKNMRLRLVTNLTTLTDEILKFLKHEKVGVCTSLDGPMMVHNKNRGDYEKTVSWINKINETYLINAMMLVTKPSLPYYKEIIDEYARLKFNTIWVKPVNELGFAQKNKNIVCTAMEFLNFWKKSLAYLLEINKKYVLKENSSLIILRKIFNKESASFADLQSPCGAAISQLAYDYDGNIYTCDEGRQYDLFKLGTVNNSYPELLTSKDVFGVVMASMNDSMIACDNCAYKPYCGICPVCSYAETGNVITKFPNRRCDIIKGMFDHIFKKLEDKKYEKMFLKWLA